MCTPADFADLREHYKSLDQRVDEIDRRLTAVETGVHDFREEARQSFTDIKAQFANLYAERTEWGKFAREWLGKIIRWLLWLIPALIGVYKVAEYAANKQ